MSDSFVSSWKVKRPATAPGGGREGVVFLFVVAVVVVEPTILARKRREAWRRFFSRFSISETDWNVGRRLVRRVRWDVFVELSVAVGMKGGC